MKCKCPKCRRNAKEDGYCNVHNPAKQRAYRKDNPEKFKAYTLKRDYGISLEAYQRLLVRQLGLCAVCSAPSGSERANNGEYKTLAVDHNHSTGFVRGLLCGHCNLGLGHFLENPQLLRRAADYLEKAALEETQEASRTAASVAEMMKEFNEL